LKTKIESATRQRRDPIPSGSHRGHRKEIRPREGEDGSAASSGSQGRGDGRRRECVGLICAATEEKVSAEARSLRIVAFAANVTENSSGDIPAVDRHKRRAYLCTATLTVQAAMPHNSLFMSLPSEG